VIVRAPASFINKTLWPEFLEIKAALDGYLNEATERIIREAKPRLAILTHYGMTVWRAHPWELAEDLSQRIGTEVKAARDGMSLEL